MRSKVFVKLMLSLCLVAGTLSSISCGGSGGHSVLLRTAVLRTMSSPTFNSLSGIIDVSGSSSLGDAQVLAIDCKAFAPGTIVSEQAVQNHWNAGRFLLLIDPQKAHMDADVLKILGTSLPAHAHAIFARKTRDTAGRPYIYVHAFRIDPNEPIPDETSYQEYQRCIEEFLAASNTDIPPAGVTNPPNGLIYLIFDYFEQPFGVYFNNTRNGNKTYTVEQFASANVRQKFTLFLQNGHVATGENQVLVQETGVEAAPFSQTYGTKGLLAEDQGGGFDAANIGWFQVELDLSSTPQDASAWAFTGNSPANANNVTTVNTSLSVGINFANPFSHGGGTFTYSSSESQQLTNWKVDNGSGGVNSQWTYTNQNPWQWNNPDLWYTSGFGGGQSFTNKFFIPNDLAKSQLQTSTKTALTTTSLLTDTQTINTDANLVWLNVFDGTIDKTILSTAMNAGEPFNVCFNMASVVPIPISSITFSQNPVDVSGGGSVTGTVTLSAFPVADVTIYLMSNSQNATVLSTCTIQQFNLSGTFQVLVNSNGLNPGQSTVATINASNGAYEAQAQLTVRNQ